MKPHGKRKPAAALVCGAIVGRRDWLAMLSREDRQYVHDVVAVLRDQPGASANAVAVALIKELSIKRNRVTVLNTIKELLNEKTRS